MIWSSCITISQNERLLQIRYFVTPPTLAGEPPVPCYGIGISDGLVTHTVPAFCPDKAEAIRTLQMLCRMQVTPTSFFEVMDDYLAAMQ